MGKSQKVRSPTGNVLGGAAKILAPKGLSWVPRAAGLLLGSSLEYHDNLMMKVINELFYGKLTHHDWNTIFISLFQINLTEEGQAFLHRSSKKFSDLDTLLEYLR